MLNTKKFYSQTRKARSSSDLAVLTAAIIGLGLALLTTIGNAPRDAETDPPTPRSFTLRAPP